VSIARAFDRHWMERATPRSESFKENLMTAITDPTFDAARDLVLEAVIDAPPDRVWAALTQPELLKQWFCPVP
jgi:hypothetical protein